MRKAAVLAVLLVAALTLVQAVGTQAWGEWLARYNGPADGADGANSLAVDREGNVYVTGQSTGPGTNDDYVTVKYDSSGNQLWVARYNSPSNGYDRAYGIVVDDAGNVYVTGQSDNPAPGSTNDYLTIKYDASGNPLWEARYNGPYGGEDRAYAIAVDDSGNVYVTGWSIDGTPASFDYATIKYDASGNQIWVARYNGPGNNADIAFDLAVDGAGNVYVGGASTGIGTVYDYATVKYDASGDSVWVARYAGTGNSSDYIYDLALDGSGNVYVTGSAYMYLTWEDYVTIKYNALGNQVWLARYNGPRGYDEWAQALALDGSGNVYVTGYSRGEGSGPAHDYATVKYDHLGHQLWTARYSGPVDGDEYAWSLAVDGEGNVYVTGGSPGNGTSSDYATLKYDTDGNQLWEARYNGPGNGADAASSLVLDGNGHVYVTGSSAGIGTAGDCATIEYSQPLPSVGVPLAPDASPIVMPTNPFSGSTELSFALESRQHVKVTIYDAAGRGVRTLLDGPMSSGVHALTWDGRDDHAGQVAPGAYFCRMETAEGGTTRKMIMLR